MSVSTEAALMVGLPHEDLVAFLGEEEVERIISDSELEVGSYYYDSMREENIVGYAVVVTSEYTPIRNDEICELLTYIKEFETTYGLIAQVYLTLKIT